MQRMSGFSLVETLVAFAILTTAFALIVPQLSFGINRTDRRIDAALAEDFARSRIDAFGRLRPAKSGAATGVVGNRWIWRENVKRAEIGNLENRPWQVTVEVFDATGRTRLAIVDGYRK